MHKRPIIGIPLDWDKGGSGGSFSPRPYYALRVHYFDAVHAAGGMPIGIPFLPDMLEDYLNMVDGLLIPGGDMASPLEWYEPADEPLAFAPSPRGAFELEILRRTLACDLPLLAICQGMQSLGGLLGGRLTRNVQKRYGGTIAHRDDVNIAAQTEYAHPVHIVPGSLLHRIVGADTIEVNTHHREAITAVGSHTRITGTAPDGVIEAIEVEDKTFALGVQWHPEYFPQPHTADGKIFKAFIAAAHGRKRPAVSG